MSFVIQGEGIYNNQWVRTISLMTTQSACGNIRIMYSNSETTLFSTIKLKGFLVPVLAIAIGMMLIQNTYSRTIMNEIKFEDFLSNHSSDEKVVDIRVEPENVYFENGRNSQLLNFDFIIEGLTDKELIIKFIKVGVYDAKNNLLTFRYLNSNAIGTSGIQTLGKISVQGKEKFDLFNPFYDFPKGLKIAYLRYTFTFFEKNSGKEFYYGDVIVKPSHYKQKVKLSIPLKGLMTITDGHDYFSHHRRFAMTIVRRATNNSFQSNFSRYALDFTLVGKDGNLRRLADNEKKLNYDFHFSDIRKFYTDGATVFSPADGEVVEIVNNLDDMYGRQFDFDKALKENRVKDIAGNFVIIKHNDHEYSHLFHFAKDNIEVKVGQKVKRGQALGRIGFSGTASVYSHLHFQLMNGKDFLKDEALPFQFRNVTLVVGKKTKKYKITAVDTGDFILQ